MSDDERIAQLETQVELLQRRVQTYEDARQVVYAGLLDVQRLLTAGNITAAQARLKTVIGDPEAIR
jgi:chaperonin cofactor prefoldin